MASGERKDLSLVFFWTLFFVQILQYESLTLWPVDSCPGNQSEVEAATLRLNCSDVRESINVYHCLPLSNLSDLVEFCYDGRSGLVEAGNCMVLYRETLNNYQCGHFKNGCPNAYYFPKNMYKYPACLKINTQNNCYIADPSCPNIRFFGTTTISSVTSTEKTTTMPTYTAVDNKSLYVEATSIPALSGNNNHRLLHLIPVLLGVLLPLLAVVLVILLSCRMDKRTGKDPAEEHELKENLFKTVNKDTSFEMDETSPLIADTPMNEDKHHELEGSLPLKSDEDYSLNEMQTYLEDNEFLERYQKYLEEGSVEVCPISQIIIVGEQGVGKTTLLYRLQGKSQEEIKAITSTRGVECHTEQHSFIITKNQLEMNLRGVSSLAVDPGHVNTFSEGKNNRC
ncbi:uncharacterized protein LOC134249126 [Saccostrea cucullata]|uniref:uncharacterized protein LOC134249126 n=1 Tax=Saccostrea cuccullata TaxID=36930 RepID=UPI002ED4A728